MGIDKVTKPSSINIVFDDNVKYLNVLRKQAEDDGQNIDGFKKLVISDNMAVFETEEYYYDDTENEILISGNLQFQEGESSIFITLPLSNTVLIDILHGALKKYNKLKTTLEALK